MSEEAEARRDGATLQRNSGRGVVEKGDAVLGSFLIDYKETGQGVTVNRKMWAKVNTDAWKMRKIPVLRLILGNEDKLRLWVFPDAIGREMIEAWEEKHGRESADNNE